jgi:cytochrome o ubiquinol oxidase subunit 2
VYATVTDMKLRHWFVVGAIATVVIFLTVILYMFMISPIVLQPSGSVGMKQRDLFVAATIIMSLVVIPVFVLLFYIAWKYRATNKKATYTPDWQSNKLLETIWWGVPIIIVVVLSVIAYRSSHSLDPFRSLDSPVAPVRVQVVALQWKWLFIYPDHNVASVNELVIPVSTPITFEITADAPMNSFWIPELGGQVYAMNGMTTELNLEANRIGDFKGVSANISGEGFADMKFTVRAVDNTRFLSTMKQKNADTPPIDMIRYEALAEPSVLTEPQWFRLAESDLHNKIVHKYMLPAEEAAGYDDSTMDMNHGEMH